MTPEICPNCGAAVPPRARACPECGADETAGWSEDARYDSVGLPDEEFDYARFVQREFSDERRVAPPHGISRFWWLVAVLVLAAFVLFFVF